MILLIVFATLAIVISFICSILEAALLSITPSYIAQLKEQHPKLHIRLQRLKTNIDRPLAAILTLNTVDRKSTRLNSSHVRISYAVFCLKKKTKKTKNININ